jgi:hypothetical protein
MSSTWATRLANGDGQRLRFYITIQGIPDVFQNSGTDLPSTVEASARPRRKMLHIPQQGGSELDLNRRRMIGGSLRFTLDEDEDGTLAALFAARTPRTTYIAADHTAAGTTITVGSNTLLDSAGTLYCMGETITWTGKSGGTQLTGATRGAYSSRALTHFGDSTDGESVYEVPPTWVGRRVYLYAYFENEDGSTTTDLVERVGTFSIESQPTYRAGEGSWTFACSELTDEVGKKILGRGIKVEPLDEPVYMGANGNLILPTRHLNRFAVGGTGATTFVIMIARDNSTGETREEATRLISKDGTSITVSNDWGWFRHRPITHLGYIARLRDFPGQCLAWAAISRLGDGANGGFDVYPGREHTDPGEAEWAFGAGIDASEVDTASFGVLTDGLLWAYHITNEHNFEEMLNDFTLLTRTFWYTNRDGKLAVKRLDPASTSTFTFSDANIEANPAPEVDLDESHIHPRVSVLCNYDDRTGEHGARFELNDMELMRMYPQIVETFEVKSRTIYVETPGVPGTDGVIRGTARIDEYELTSEELVDLVRSQLQIREPRSIVSFRSDLSSLDVELGDVVTVSVNVPDLEGNSTITTRRALVIGKQPRWDEGKIDWKVSLLASTVQRVAPAVTIQSAAGAVLTLRVNSSTYPEASGADPGDMFAAGQSVRLYDVSAATTEERTILSCTSTTITLTAAPSFAVQNDVDFLTMGDQNTTESGDSANGYSDFDFAYQMPDAENADATYMITRQL